MQIILPLLVIAFGYWLLKRSQTGERGGQVSARCLRDEVRRAEKLARRYNP